MKALRQVLDDVLGSTSIPSLSLTVRVAEQEVFHHTAGMARIQPPRPVVADQAYDLASVTKVLSGTAIAASLIAAGQLELDGSVADHLPDVDERITLRMLMNHSSGALWWRPFYDLVDGQWGTAAARKTVLDAVRAEPLVTPPGDTHRYSDTGFLLLLQVLEKVGGAPLDVLFHHHVRAPSGVADLRYGWPTAAATEHCPIRTAVLEGTVHDQNCASMGGVSSHAGLFGTSRAVAQLGEAFLEATLGNPRYDGLPGPTLRQFWSDKGPGSHAVGWDTISPGYSSTGSHFPPDSIGHLGYTGNSLWIVPSKRSVVALLTNRVHPDDDKETIRAVRPRIHDAVAQALGWA